MLGSHNFLQHIKNKVAGSIKYHNILRSMNLIEISKALALTQLVAEARQYMCQMLIFQCSEKLYNGFRIFLSNFRWKIILWKLSTRWMTVKMSSLYCRKAFTIVSWTKGVAHHSLVLSCLHRNPYWGVFFGLYILLTHLVRRYNYIINVKS